MPEININPFILKVSNGDPNYKDIATKLHRAITESCGKPKDSLVLGGVLLEIPPYDIPTKTPILGIQELLDKKSKAPPPQKRQIVCHKNVVLFSVPVCDHEEGILEVLAGKDVTQVN
jgi:hypothetical protein